MTACSRVIDQDKVVWSRACRLPLVPVVAILLYPTTMKPRAVPVEEPARGTVTMVWMPQDVARASQAQVQQVPASVVEVQ